MQGRKNINPGLRVFLRASGFGAGVVIAAGVIVGAWLYVASLPQKPRPWNRDAIKATFAGVYVRTGERIVTTFRYRVANKTKNDYYFPHDKGSAFIILPEGKGLSQEQEIVWGQGTYVPAGQKILTSFQLTYDYNDSYPQKERDDLNKLNKFMHRHLKEVAGFVIFAKMNHYETVFPGGWKDGVK